MGKKTFRAEIMNVNILDNSPLPPTKLILIVKGHISPKLKERTKTNNFIDHTILA
jgi:hypothetical protein